MELLLVATSYWRLRLTHLSSNLGLDFQRCLKTQKGTEDIQRYLCLVPIEPIGLFVDESTSIKGMNSIKGISSRPVIGGILIYKCGISRSSASYICSLPVDRTRPKLGQKKKQTKKQITFKVVDIFPSSSGLNFPSCHLCLTTLFHSLIPGYEGFAIHTKE